MWFDGIKHRRAIQLLQQRHERYDAKMQVAIEDAKRRHERDEYDALVSEYLFERDEFEEEIRRLETQFLTRQARRYLIPVPPTEEGPHWEKSENSGRYLLKLNAMRLRA